MKISPIAQGSGVPGQSLNPTSQTIDPGKVARAKAIAAGEAPPEVPQSSGDPQVDRINTRRIKMKTQVSTNRQDVIEPQVTETEVVPEMSTTDTIEPTAEPVEETKPLSPQFAALAKAKRALQVKERELAQREANLKTQNPAGNEDLIAKLKSKPLDVLLENGVTYDQLTEAIIAQQSGNTPEILALKAEVNALKEAMDNQFSSRDKAAEEQVLADLTREAQALTAQGDQFEAVREARAQSEVVKLIHRVWKNGWADEGYRPGDVMDMEKAAEFVENQLINEALPFAKLSKVQKRLTPAEAAQVEAQLPSTPKPNTKIMRTLTNRDTASPIMDRRARAIAAMQGTLKKG